MLNFATNQGTESKLASFEITPNSEEAARLIMDWRNDPVTLAQSFHSSPKSWPQFFEEFTQEYISDPSLPNLFILRQGVRVGFIRLRHKSDPTQRSLKCVDISINIAPDKRGQGIGGKAIADLLPLLRSWGVELAIADVKADNEASLRTFKKNGFRFLDQFSFQDNISSGTAVFQRYVIDLGEHQ